MKNRWGLFGGVVVSFVLAACLGGGGGGGGGGSAASKTNQTISFGVAPTVVVGGTGIVSASATSGLTVSFSSLSTSVCTVSGSTVTGVAAGVCIVAADQAGNASYNAAPQVTQSITVTAATGTINGVVANNTTGQGIAGATVIIGTHTATTAADGTYSLAGVAASSRAVVNVTAAGYAQGSQVVAVFSNNVSRANVALLPVAHTQTFSSAVATTVAVPNSVASVALPANGLSAASGVAPVGNITIAVTPIDPSSNPQIMPGDFSNSTGGRIESFGAMDVTMRDTLGNSINLIAGATATIRIPVATAASGTALPATMPAWYYNATTGQWVNEGTLTLAGVAPNQYYEGAVTHFSTWNADQTLNTTCITGKVVDNAGSPVANARVTSSGQGYVGTSATYSAADGTFTLSIKANAGALVSAQTATSQSNTVAVTGGAAGTTCTAMAANLALGSTTSSGSAAIRLTWGANPSDLDSHLTGPIAGSVNRFHVYFANRGSLTLAPGAQLDVDDTTGFGPEVITISSFIPGRYRYSVHHWTGTGDIAASPARVELTLNGVTRIFTPPASATILGVNSVWQVMDITVDAAGGVTVTPLNTYTTAFSSGVLGASKSTTKSPFIGGNW